MHKRKSKKKPAPTSVAARRPIGSASTPVAPADPKAFVSEPKLRKLLDVSAVTLWRWRHDKTSGFPAAKVIKGRLYFPWGAVSDWIARQPEAACYAREPLVIVAGGRTRPPVIPPRSVRNSGDDAWALAY